MHKFTFLPVFASPRAFDSVETVIIKGENGDPVRINASDFDSKTMKLHSEDKNDAPPPVTENTFTTSAVPPIPASAPVMSDGTQHQGAHVANTEETVEGDGERRVVLSEPIAPAATSAPKRFVSKIGSKFYVVDEVGAKVESDSINAAGYKTEAEAQEAAYPTA